MDFVCFSGSTLPDGVKGVLVLVMEGEAPTFPGCPAFASALASAETLKGKSKDRALGLSPEGLWVAMAGVGGASSVEVMTSVAEGLRSLAAKGCESVAVVSSFMDRERSVSVAEGAVLGLYRFDRYKAKDPDERFKLPSRVHVMAGDHQAMAEGAVLGAAQNYARDLANEPGNVITPSELARRALELAERCGCEARVLDEVQMREMGMNAILAVGAGSANPPRLIHLVRRVDSPKAKVALVGKGLTFDSGGLNIKPGDSMRTMKGDKSGACTVLGAFLAACELDLPVELHVVVAAVENMPDGGSYRPDDIIRTYSGKTVEVVNTDAEGRLTLADALHYACSQGVDHVLDVATLTGACVVALGENTAGLFTPDDLLSSQLEAAFRYCGERVWRLPIDDEQLKEELKSPVADMTNCGSRYGGAITAALFLKEFVSDSVKWAHLDIAGVDAVKKTRGVLVEGASGFGVRPLVRWVKGL